MRRNPCKGCEYATVWKNKYYHSWLKLECRVCEKYKAHEEYLESQRKYRQGDIITDINELSRQTFVYFHGRIKHIEVIRSNAWRTVDGWLKNGVLRYAIRKEEHDTVERTNT